MPNLLRCSQGHEWEPLSNAPAAEVTVCPSCGSTVASAPVADPAATLISVSPDDDDPGATGLYEPARESSEISARDSVPNKSISRSSSARQKSLEIPGYEILGELGRGGMGVVYKARQIGLNRIVALKMVLAGSHAGADELARFRAEAEAVARLQHSSIVQIYEIGECEGRPYFALEYVDGGTLAQKLAGTPLPPREAAQLIELLAQAVAYAHEHGIVHRDLKPANVLLQQERSTSDNIKMDTKSRRGKDTGLLADSQNKSSVSRSISRVSSVRHSASSVANVPFPKITDFGLAKQMDTDSSQTRSGTIMGTPSYMAPEQAAGLSKDIGPTADIYSLGAMLYEMLVGRPPFRAATMLETLEQVRSQEPVAPSRLQPGLPRDLETICLKCLQKDSAKRYESADSLANDIAKFLAGEPIAARPVSPAERAWRWAKRKPMLAGLMAAVSALIVVVVVVPSVLAVRLDAARKLSDFNAANAKRNQNTAEINERAAQSARAEALALAEESHSRLIGLRIATGVNSANEGKHQHSLLWFTKAWLDDKHGSRNEQHHRLRIGSAISQIPELIGLCVRPGKIRDAQFDPAGRWLLLRDGSQAAHLWDPFEGRPLGEFVHGSVPTYANFSPDGKSVVTCGDHSLKLWNTQTRALIHEWEHPDQINWADFHPNNSHLATTCDDGRVRIWDLKTENLSPSEFVCGKAARFVQFAPSGNFVVAVDAADKATVWSFPDGVVLAKDLPHRLEFKADHVDMGCRPQFADHGRRLVTFHSGTIQVWDTSTWKPLKSYSPAGNAIDLAINEAGDRVVVATQTANARLFHMTDQGKPTETFSLLNPRQTYHVAMSPDGSLAASSSTSGVVSVWNAADGKPFATVRHNSMLKRLSMTRGTDGHSQLLSVGDDGTVRVWKLGSPSFRLRPYEFDCGFATNAGWIRRGEKRVIRSTDGQREFHAQGSIGRIHSLNGDEPLGAEIRHPQKIEHALFSQDGRRLLTADDHECIVRDSATGVAIGPTITSKGIFARIRMSDDGSRVLTLGKDNLAQVWSTETGTLLLGQMDIGAQKSSKTGSTDFHVPGIIEDFGLFPDGQHLVLRISKAERAIVYRVDDGSQVLETDYQKGVAAAMQFSADSRRFIVSNSDTRSRVWDVHTGTAAGPFLRHPTFVRFGNISPDGQQAATYAADGKLRIWSAETGDLLIAGPAPLAASVFWFNRDASRIVARRNNDGQLTELILPNFRAPRELGVPFVELLCCEKIDETDGIAELELDQFRRNPQLFLDAWRAARSSAP